MLRRSFDWRCLLCALWLLTGCPTDDHDVPAADGGTELEHAGGDAGAAFGDGELPGPKTGGGGAAGTGAGFSASSAGGDGEAAGADIGSGGGAGTGASEPGTVGGTGEGGAQSGVLTAGVWDDNLNYDHFSAFRNKLQQSDVAGLWPTTDDEHHAAHEDFSGARNAKTTLDISLVIDTTGSMGDELSYLQAELTGISKAIETQHPNAEQRWSLVVYKDEGDEYVVRWFDFRDSADQVREKLALEQASGGGDFPEAPDQAFEVMNQLSWRSGDSTARLAFWIADAPAHDDKVTAMLDAVRGAVDQGIHVYPVASSGIDETTELGMREAAQLTGGRYIFLTDDSGVGGAHLEPSIPCYFVTRLDHAILRMVDIELSGKYREPDESQVVRTGGDPQDRTCSLESGDDVEAF